jgi:hypothetical protein
MAKKKENIQSIVLNAVALAMGVVGTILGILKTTSLETILILYGIGLFCLGLNGLDKE